MNLNSRRIVYVHGAKLVLPSRPGNLYVVTVGRRIHAVLAAHLDGVGDTGLLLEAAVVSYKGYVKGETLYARAVHSTDSNAEHAIARTANCQVVARRESCVRGPAHQYCKASNRVHEVNVYAHDSRVDAVDDVELATQKESVVS
jgi:hypothetical protein